MNALDECGRSPLQLALSRLRLIEEDEITHLKLRSFKTVVMEVVELLSIYLSKVGHIMDEQENLDDLCNKLEKTTSIQQVYVLLSDVSIHFMYGLDLVHTMPVENHSSQIPAL